MQIIEIGLTGSSQQLPSYPVSDKGMLLLRPSGSSPMYIGSASVEINLPLPEGFSPRFYPRNSGELFITGVAGETAFVVVDRAS